eukprot:7271622-Prymnesium_polylepis.2
MTAIRRRSLVNSRTLSSCHRSCCRPEPLPRSSHSRISETDRSTRWKPMSAAAEQSASSSGEGDV